jgi:hypothetical protein
MFKKGQTIILDGAEYEVIDFGDISWEGKMYHDCYALWDKDDYGRIEKRSYVEENAR